MIRLHRNRLASRILIGFIGFAFFANFLIPAPLAHAQSVLNLPSPGTMVTPTTAYVPALMRGVAVNAENPLEFNFVIDTGHSSLAINQLETESKKLIKYFLAALTVSEKDMWVNLSPYEKGKIIPQKFGQTEMGRDLLAQDYLLKQLTSSLMYPADNLGKRFWDRVYQKARQEYGITDIPMNTFNKIWILPHKAKVYENKDGAYVVSSRLKVMLEEDFVALQKNQGNELYGMDPSAPSEISDVSAVTTDVIREVLIPEIEREVNKGKNFANLRQIYNSVILATWYKLALKESLLGKVYVDQNKVTGVDVADKKVNQKIYEQYLKAFKKGVYDYIREDYDEQTQEVIPRRYFSGGIPFKTSWLLERTQDLTGEDAAMVTRKVGDMVNVTARLYAANSHNRLVIDAAERGEDAAMTAEVSKRVEEFMSTQAIRMSQQLEQVYGATPEEIPELARQGNPFAVLGFEHEKANRMGFLMPSLNWILNTPEGKNALQEVIRDGAAIRDEFGIGLFAGMGGSGLSVQVAKDTFSQPDDTPIFSLRTTDPSAIRDVLSEITAITDGDVQKALEQLKIVVISKSGGTAETVAHLKYFLNMYEAFGISPTRHVIIYTDPDSQMDWQKHVGKDFSGIADAAKRQQRLEFQAFLEDIKPQVRYIQLNQKTDVGGRNTAPTTNVALLPEAVLDGDIVEPILDAARTANYVHPDENIFIRLGAYLYYMAEIAGKDKVTFIVPPELKSIFIWAEQLFEESLGKQGKGVTLFMEDELTRDMLKPVATNDRVFLRINTQKTETRKEFVDSLKEQGYPVFDINVQDALDMGGLQMGLQDTVLTMGYLWKIVPIDQDPVENYKKETSKIMAELEPGERVTVPEEWLKGFVRFGRGYYTLYYQPILDAARQRQAFIAAVEQDDANIPIPVQVERLIQYGFMTKTEYIRQYKETVLPQLKKAVITEEELYAEVARLGTKMDDAPAVYAAFHNIAARKGALEVADLFSFGRMTPEFENVLQAGRYGFSRQYQIPTKLAEGPDFLHSFFVNIADGPDQRISTIFLPDEVSQPDFYKDDPKLMAKIRAGEISETDFEFDENLLRAPAIGTIKGLTNIGRKAMLITVDGEIDDLGAEMGTPGLEVLKNFFTEAEKYMRKAQIPREGLSDSPERVVPFAWQALLRVYEKSPELIISKRHILEEMETIEGAEQLAMQTDRFSSIVDSFMDALVQMEAILPLDNLAEGIYMMNEDMLDMHLRSEDNAAATQVRPGPVLEAVRRIRSESQETEVTFNLLEILEQLRQQDETFESSTDTATGVLKILGAFVNMGLLTARLNDFGFSVFTVIDNPEAYVETVEQMPIAPQDDSDAVGQIIKDNAISVSPLVVLDILREIQNASPQDATVTIGGLVDILLDKERSLKRTPGLYLVVENIMLDLKEKGLLTEDRTEEGFKLFTVLGNPNRFKDQVKDRVSLAALLRQESDVNEDNAMSVGPEAVDISAMVDQVLEQIKSKSSPGIVITEDRITNQLLSQMGDQIRNLEAVRSVVRSHLLLKSQGDNSELLRIDEGYQFRRLGGINLDPSLLELNIARDEQGVPLPQLNVDPQTVTVDGFIPVIINIAPVPAMDMLLGLNQEQTDPMKKS